MTVGELLDTHGARRTVRCGCIGWVSGHPRVTRGTVAIHGVWRYARCDECGKIKKSRVAGGGRS